MFRSRIVRIAIFSLMLVAIVGALTLWSTADMRTATANAQTNSTWDTSFSQKFGVTLVNQYDSSGPAAWDSQAHPVVFFTTIGPGYGGMLSKTNTKPGVAVIDAKTKEVVASATFDITGAKDYFEPHGLGVSSDGRWIYLPTGTSASFSAAGTSRLLVIDALTLKLNKELATPAAMHHAEAFTDSTGKSLVLAYAFFGNYYALDPNDDNKVVGGILTSDLFGRGYLGFPDPSGKYLFITVRPPSGVESEGSVAIVDTTTWKLIRNIGVIDPSPIWVAFTADGKTAYVSGGEQSLVIRLDISDPSPAKWAVTGKARAGTEGPYGIHLNWDEKQIWTTGKGEGSHNLGITMGLVKTTAFIDKDTLGRPANTYYTGCVRADHSTLNPDPQANEMWITCNSSFEVVVLNLANGQVTQRIPMPNGASTHSGSFVKYVTDSTGKIIGEVLSDQDGLHGSALQAKKDLLGIK